MGSGIIVKDCERLNYDVAKFVFKDNPNLKPVSIRLVNDDNYGDIVLFEYILDALNNGYIAEWNRDTCCWELCKNATMGG